MTGPRNPGNIGMILLGRVDLGQPSTEKRDVIASPPARSPRRLPDDVLDDGNQLSAVLPAQPHSAADARSLVFLACNRWAAAGICGDAQLVVTELVANAVHHAGTDITVRLTRIKDTPGGLRAEVSDTSTRPVRPRHAQSLEEGGRGLFLVDTLSSRWGAEANGHGKTVWAEIIPDVLS